MSALERLLERSGEAIAGFWLSLLGIVILLSFPITGLVASLALGAAFMEMVGRGTFGLILFFGTAFFFGLFLSIYVWEPRVKPLVLKVSDLISGAK
jgi:hypothetical protein